MERKTPLYDCHVALKGKIVPFAGYLLPVQYEKSGIIAEHMAVRTKAGLFDVSHMGEFHLFGTDALKNLQFLLCNDYTNLKDGFVRYSPMCYDNGGVVDDLLVYQISENNYFIVVNAANREKDSQWIQAHLFGDVAFEDISDDIAQLALQGPLAEQILKPLTKETLPQKNYTFVKEMSVSDIPCLVSRTGYTGEDGFELYCAKEDAAQLWNLILEAGEPYGLIPCGLGARDTLRLEASMPLYGHEMDETITPIETNLSFFVKMQKADFIGKSAMEEMGTPSRMRIGLSITGRGIAREQCKVYKDGKEIGWVTSGTHCPYLGRAVAMAILSCENTEPGTCVQIDVRGRMVDAEVISLPFYKRSK